MLNRHNNNKNSNKNNKNNNSNNIIWMYVMLKIYHI